MKKRTILAIAICIIMIIGVACAPAAPASPSAAAPESAAPESVAPEPVATDAAAPADTNDKLAKIKAAGKIVMGISPDYPPFDFIDFTGEKEEVSGIDVLIGKEIAKDLGVELETKQMQFDSILAALPVDKVDIGISAFTPDEERKKTVDFSSIYYEARQAVLIRKGDESKYTAVDSFKGLKVGAQIGSTQEGFANEQLVEAEVRSLPEVPTLVAELKAKKLEGVVLELPVAESFARQHDDLVISTVPITQPAEEAGLAVALNKGNQTLLDEINKTIDRLVKENVVMNDYYINMMDLSNKQPGNK